VQGINLPGGPVSVTITDATGCVITASTNIPEVGGCEIELPNGFSPNGDGFNDGYVIKNIEGYPANHFQVFNRWGNIVYEKESYTNADWIGQNMSGDDLPEGTYFVMIELYGLDIKKNTYVDLRRLISH
jgi:gliding motility-associated-like protein